MKQNPGLITSVIKLTVLIITIALIFFSCASTKEGCGTENYKHKFSK